MPVNFNLLRQAGPTNFAEGLMQGQDQQNALLQQQQQRQLSDIQLRNALRGEQEAMAESEAVKGSASLEDLAGRYRKAGLGKQALATEAALAKQRADKLAAAKSQTELLKTSATRIMSNPDPTATVRELQRYQQLTGVDMSDDIADVQGMTPEKIKQWAAGYSMEADKLLPQFREFSTPAGGKQIGAVNPVTGAFTAAQTLAPEMTPAQIEANKIARGQLGVAQGQLQVARDRLANDKTKDGDKASVSEQQASYNVSRVLNAANQIKKISDKSPSAAKPGVGEAFAASIGMEGTANLSRNADRQIVYGAQRDALDALLYLATGAAYNKEQLAGQMAAYIPAFTDKESTIAAKKERLSDLVKSAKIRAGKAWTPDMEAAMQTLVSAEAPAGKKPTTAANKTPATPYSNLSNEELLKQLNGGK